MDNRIDVYRFKDKRKKRSGFSGLEGAFEMKCSQLLEHNRVYMFTGKHRCKGQCGSE